MTNPLRSLAFLCCVSLVVACASRQATISPKSSPASANAGDSAPRELLGEFGDDYDARYTITATEWRHARNRFHVIRWDSAGQYLIARNDTANAGDKGLYTRIDWLRLEGMPPYAWAYCYSAYKAPTADSAARSTVARRETPRTGCNGYPFTRMKRAE
jgi:hypothetical protein